MTIQLHTLSNGFRIVTEDMPGLKSASIGIWIQAGGRHERIEQNGIAHFLEHMAFKGTKTRSALAIAEAIEDRLTEGQSLKQAFITEISEWFFDGKSYDTNRLDGVLRLFDEQKR